MNKRIGPFLKAGLIAVGAFVAMLIVTNLPFLFLLELKGLDLLFLLRGSLLPPPELVIVASTSPPSPRYRNNGHGLVASMPA